MQILIPLPRHSARIAIAHHEARQPDTVLLATRWDRFPEHSTPPDGLGTRSDMSGAKCETGVQKHARRICQSGKECISIVLGTESDLESPPLGGGKRILLTTFGSFGDLYPFIALALGLKARGHEPIIGTSGNYRAVVEARGVGFRHIRPDFPAPGEIPDLMKEVMDPRRGMEAVVRRFLLPSLRESYDDLFAATHDVDLLVSHLLTFATPLVAEVRGLPWASTALQPSAFLSATAPPVLAQAPYLARIPFLGPWFWRRFWQSLAERARPWFAPWHALRAELGLPPAAAGPLLGNHSPWLVLALFSPRFAPPQPDWPPRTVVTGFPFLAAPGGTLAPKLEAFLDSGPAPIVFTLGSSAVMTPGAFYGESARAAARLGRRAVLLVGQDADTWNASLPEGIRAVDYAPHAALFPRAAAVVHQGGIGTTAEAMRAGRPMLVMPFAHDQFDNARRIERLRIGREISRKRYDGEYAFRELRRLLDDPAVNDRAVQIGHQIRREDGVGTACDALDALIAKRDAFVPGG